MKVLVTGGAGYIGSHTAQALLKARHQVVVYDNLSTGFQESIPSECEFVLGDVRDTSLLGTVLQKFKIDAVIHFAAKLIVPESIEKPLEYYENNTVGVMSLAEACVKQNVLKIIFSSTAAVYGNSMTSGLVSEDSSVAPLNPYGSSKLMSEQILRDCEAPYGLRSVCLRYFNVAGASVAGNNGQRTKDATHLIKVACETACGKRKQVSVFGTDYPTLDGTGVRDYIHIDDLADLHVLALNYLQNGGKSDIFNCGYGHGFSVKQVLAAIKKTSGVDFRVEEKPRRAGDAASVVANAEKIRRTFSWTPKYDDLDLICQTAYKWEKGS